MAGENPNGKQIKKNAEREKKKKSPRSIIADPQSRKDSPPRSKIRDKGSRSK